MGELQPRRKLIHPGSRDDRPETMADECQLQPGPAAPKTWPYRVGLLVALSCDYRTPYPVNPDLARELHVTTLTSPLA